MADEPIGPAVADQDLFMRVVAGICAILIVFGFFGITILLMFRPIVEGNTALLNQLLGALTLAFGGLMGYLYGRSSIGDTRSRAEAQAKILEASASPPPPPPPAGPTDSSGKPIVKVEADPAHPLPVTESPAPAPTRGALMTFRAGVRRP